MSPNSRVKSLIILNGELCLVAKSRIELNGYSPLDPEPSINIPYSNAKIQISESKATILHVRSSVGVQIWGVTRPTYRNWSVWLLLDVPPLTLGCSRPRRNPLMVFHEEKGCWSLDNQSDIFQTWMLRNQCRRSWSRTLKGSIVIGQTEFGCRPPSAEEHGKRRHMQ
jgi:hypothetical protein